MAINPTFNYNAFLISKEITLDELNQEIEKEIKTEILCDEVSIGRNEFYMAQQSNVQIDLMLIINEFEFSGQRHIEFNSKTFEILKIYKLDNGLLELTCKEVYL